MGNFQATPEKERGIKVTIVNFSQEHIDAGKVNCCVCLEDYVLEQSLVQCPQCTQLFHVHCIRRHLKSRRTCPLCRYDFISRCPTKPIERRYTYIYTSGGYGPFWGPPANPASLPHCTPVYCLLQIGNTKDNIIVTCDRSIMEL